MKDRILERIEELKEEIENEKEEISECRALGCSNSYGAGMAHGSLEAMRLEVEFLESLLS